MRNVHLSLTEEVIAGAINGPNLEDHRIIGPASSEPPGPHQLGGFAAVTASLPMPWYRTFVLLIALALASGVLVPLAAPAPTEAVSPDVVISQVYGGGGNSGATLTHDFIELYNRGEFAVDLSTWSVQYAPPGRPGRARTYRADAAGFPLPRPGGQEPAGQRPPTPDATGTISMSATAGKVALVTNQTPCLRHARQPLPAQRVDP